MSSDPVTAGTQSSRKRPRSENSRTDNVYSRKRATAACRVCRTRKIKCDNFRPSCGACLTSKATCVYEGPQDYSTFDPASLLILDRLDQVLSKLDKPSISPQNEIPKSTDKPNLDLDELHIPVARITPDSVLQWPIFLKRYPPNYFTDAAYAARFEDIRPDRDDLSKPTTNKGGVNEVAIPGLVQRFFNYVHIKNPILDTNALWAYAKYAAEEGLKWDSASCLVLLASALGSIAQPYTRDELHCEAFSSHSKGATVDADVYFNMARKRFGLLDDGLLAPQCHFLAGIYLMFKLQPLAAWPEFHMASTLCYMYLQCESRRSDCMSECTRASRDRQLEQSLYWSCYKSECEFRAEMNLPVSSLPELDYPDKLPTPPIFEVFATDDMESIPGGEKDNIGTPNYISSSAREESWFYYLTEITLRRISNDVLNTFYLGDCSNWNDEAMPFMVRAAEQFEKQLDEWYQTLPALISFKEDEVPERELPYLVRDRMLEIRNWLYRPFLYFAIHATPDAPAWGLVKHLVDKAVLYSLYTVRDEPVHHRHHGTWFAIRGAVSIALGVLGAARCGHVCLPSNWKASMMSCIDKIRYWLDESPDVFRMVEVLETYLQEFEDP